MAISGVSAWADFGARLLNASGPKVEYNLGSAEAKKKKKVRDEILFLEPYM